MPPSLLEIKVIFADEESSAAQEHTLRQLWVQQLAATGGTPAAYYGKTVCYVIYWIIKYRIKNQSGGESYHGTEEK